GQRQPSRHHARRLSDQVPTNTRHRSGTVHSARRRCRHGGAVRPLLHPLGHPL
ncbi:MAG: hypothetical protein AVDCRST_MAG08-4328, partial [uncultured Acetobacteraceae bacterium]